MVNIVLLIIFWSSLKFILGMAFTTISFKGKVHIIVTLDQAISKTLGKTEQLLRLIEKELEELQYGDSTNL